MKNYFAGFGLALLSSLAIAGIGYLVPVDAGGKTPSDEFVILLALLFILMPVVSFILAYTLKKNHSKQFFRGILTVAFIEIPLLLAGIFLAGMMISDYIQYG